MKTFNIKHLPAVIGFMYDNSQPQGMGFNDHNARQLKALCDFIDTLN